MAVYRLGSKVPRVPPSAFVAEDACVIGEVVIGERSSVWPGASIRGDNVAITVGDDSNVQEGAVLHADPSVPLVVGNRVSIGHQAMLHGCTVGDGSLIGIQAIVMNNAVIGRDSLVGAGSIVTEGKSFPDGSLIIGTPARVLRPLSEDEIAGMHANAADYGAKAAQYKVDLQRID
jgi:carbonic anhydrase/acetyltransferase-like protein (isoleucine patch superfamily)